jgi:4-hydroxybenzoate polyprenyltransferase
MAYAAVQDDVPPIAWALVAVNLFWVIAYDTEYAMVGRDDDVRIGIRTSASRSAASTSPPWRCGYAVYLAGMAWAGPLAADGAVYYGALAVALVIAIPSQR